MPLLSFSFHAKRLLHNLLLGRISALRCSLRYCTGALLFALSLCGAMPSAHAIGLLYQIPLVWQNEFEAPITLAHFKGKPVVMTMSYGACKKSARPP